MPWSQNLTAKAFCPIIASIILTITISCKDKEIDVSIQKTSDFDIKKHRNAIVSVECNDHNDHFRRKFDKDVGYIDMQICESLILHGINPYAKDIDSTIKIVCIYTNSIGLPEFGRHFDIRFKHINYINIQIIDTKLNSKVAEATYKRHIWENVPNHLIETMIIKLIYT